MLSLPQKCPEFISRILLFFFAAYFMAGCTPAVPRAAAPRSRPDSLQTNAFEFSQKKITVTNEDSRRQKKYFKKSAEKREIPAVELMDARPYMRVAILKHKDWYMLNSFGRFQFLDESGDTIPGIGAERGSFRIQRQGQKLLIISETGGAHHTVGELLRVKSSQELNIIKIDEMPYRGLIEFRAGDAEGLQVINEISIEEYLRGVLPCEMPSEDRSIIEALKAQAVAARSYALRHQGQFAKLGFDVYDDERDQVYKGARVETFMSDKAVAGTEGVVLMYKGDLVKCYYHSTCGGVTAAAHQVWDTGPVGYLQSMNDKDPGGKPYCISSSYINWFEKWDRQVLVEIIKKNQKSAKITNPLDFNSIIGLEVRERTSSGRVSLLEIITDKGKLEVKGDKTRWALRRNGPEEKILYSSWFEIKRLDDQVFITGRGNGHGIGMCQRGAMGRAKQGQAYEVILSAYYAGTELAGVNFPREPKNKSLDSLPLPGNRLF